LKRFIRYLTSRPLWVNIIVAITAFLLILLLFMLSLNLITQHGVSRTVPLVKGKTLDQVREILEKDDFEVVVQDSVYYDSLPALMVIKQVPEAGAVVKVNRTIYVTVNRAVAPDIDMPNLVGFSFRNAEMTMKNLGLVLGDTTFRPYFAKNSVLDQLYNGNPIAAGTKVKIGSKIDLVLGSGVGNEDMPVPQLLGMTYAEAKAVLEGQGIILGSSVFQPDVTDKEGAFVYKQIPPAFTDDGRQYRIRPGQMIDVWLGVEKPNVDSLIRPKPRPKPQPTDTTNDNDY
jgi:beta-lactam-binding protein with PASTA domain